MDKINLNVQKLSKKYAGFSLENASLYVPQGMIVGLIGENGAGKSTILKSVLGLIEPDAGTIEIFGVQKQSDSYTKEDIGVVFDDGNFPEHYTPIKLNKVMQAMYTKWDEAYYFSLLDKLAIPKKRKIKQLSKGMKMKLAIIVAFSHHSRLLILDEPTSGLDPIIRDDILDLFLEFVQEESHSILVSSHITSDLEKIADYIVFLHKGRVIFQKQKDELLYKYGMLKCTFEQFQALHKQDMLAYRKQDYEWQVLIRDKDLMQEEHPDFVISPVSIDEIMMLYVRGEVL